MTALDMYRGDDRDWTFTLTEDGGPMDLSGAVVRFTAKHAESDPDVDAVIAKSSAGTGVAISAPASSGVVTVSVVGSDTEGLSSTARLAWDLQVSRGGKTRTVVAGVLTVRPDVSRTAP